MGELIRVTCSSCGFDREENVGVGMMGIGVELCPCYHCHRFVTKKVNHIGAAEPPTLRCPYCRRVLQPVERGDKCAICAHQLRIETIAEWD
jgi:hypothetical protein